LCLADRCCCVFNIQDRNYMASILFNYLKSHKTWGEICLV
jgi:hypothetical protein